MKKPKKWKQAKRIAEFLFTPGGSDVQAERLVLEMPDGSNGGGGWCKSAVRDRVFEILTEK